MTTDVNALVEYARRSHDNAERTANAAMRMEQAAGRMEREIGEHGRKIEKLARDMRAGFEALNAAVAATQPEALSWDDFEVTRNGGMRVANREKVTRVVGQALHSQRNRTDARRWRSALKVVGKLALGAALVIVGILIRHFLGGHL